MTIEGGCFYRQTKSGVEMRAHDETDAISSAIGVKSAGRDARRCPYPRGGDAAAEQRLRARELAAAPSACVARRPA
jgi:hypothetical protein